LISHAKTYVRHSLLADEEPNLSQLNRIATRRFPNDPALHFAIRHTAALGAMMAVKHDLARTWLSTLIGDTAATGNLEAWGKATWALARMEALLENDAQAAFCYLDLAANEQTPSRFRIQAMLRGLRHLGKTGDHSTDIGQLTENIRFILNGTDDFRILLDAARQLALAGSNFSQLKNEAADRGTALADKAIAAAKIPQEQLTHLEYLARKLYWDLGRTRQLTQRWEALTEKQKADYHATGGSTWYEYLSLVFLSLTEADRSAEAIALASSVLDHDTATPEGYVILGSTYAEYLLHNGQKDKAFEYFTWIVKEIPNHRISLVAHYWKLLQSYKRGREDLVIVAAAKARLCLAGQPSLLKEYQIDAKIELLLNELDMAKTTASRTGFHAIDFLEINRLKLLYELEITPN
jgi:hypothetical protein